MSESETRRVVDALYKAYLVGDEEAMLAQMAEDVEVCFLGQGTFRGIPAVRRFLEFSGQLLRDLDFRIKAKVIDGELGCVIWEETASKLDGQPWSNHGVDVIRVEGGAIASLHENNDVALVHRYLPRYVDVEHPS